MWCSYIHYLPFILATEILYITYTSLFTGPPKVQGVAFGSNTVMNGKIHQEITWTEIELNHSTFEEYKIRYGVGAFPSTTDPNRDSSETSNTSLMFNFNASNITYYVQVAVKPMNMPRGDFSDPVNITYTSKLTLILILASTKLCDMIIQDLVGTPFSDFHVYLHCLFCFVFLVPLKGTIG